jgi:hypothetical protein
MIINNNGDILISVLLISNIMYFMILSAPTVIITGDTPLKNNPTESTVTGKVRCAHASDIDGMVVSTNLVLIRWVQQYQDTSLYHKMYNYRPRICWIFILLG